jgi:hypothetical protein
VALEEPEEPTRFLRPGLRLKRRYPADVNPRTIRDDVNAILNAAGERPFG